MYRQRTPLTLYRLATLNELLGVSGQMQWRI